MKLIVNIQDEEYRCIKKSDNSIFADIAEKECMLHVIKNGIPLKEWLASFNTESATACFTAIQELKKQIGGDR